MTDPAEWYAGADGIPVARPEGNAVPDPHDLAARFATFGEQLYRESDEPPVQRVVERAVDLVPACDACALMLRRRRGRLVTPAASAPVAERCDNLQYHFEEGPCLESVWENETYLSDDLATDPRWPRWGPAAAEEGVHSVLSVRLANDEETLGALNFYSTRRAAFSSDDVDIALIFASHATMAMSSHQVVSGLRTALQSRHLIGVAQGILMSRYGVSLDTAFGVLRRCSNDNNLRLSELASRVIDAGGIPTEFLPDFELTDHDPGTAVDGRSPS